MEERWIYVTWATGVELTRGDTRSSYSTGPLYRQHLKAPRALLTTCAHPSLKSFPSVAVVPPVFEDGTTA